MFVPLLSFCQDDMWEFDPFKRMHYHMPFHLPSFNIPQWMVSFLWTSLLKLLLFSIDYQHILFLLQKLQAFQTLQVLLSHSNELLAFFILLPILIFIAQLPQPQPAFNFDFDQVILLPLSCHPCHQAYQVLHSLLPQYADILLKELQPHQD